jgi:hypothetical protein
MNVDEAQAAPAVEETAPATAARVGYGGAVVTSFLHTLSLLRRHRWSMLGIVVAFLPVLIPIVIAFFDAGPTLPRGVDVFTQITEKLYLRVVAPLFALFFGCMLIADDVESHTIQYILIRPVPRTATVLGRFAAYLLFVSLILVSSLTFVFAASTSLGDFPFSPGNWRLLAHYSGVLAVAMTAYGAASMFLGAVFSKRPVIYGVALFFGWQRLAMVLPGVADFLTIEKYTNALLPPLATQRDNPVLKTAIAEFQKSEYIVGAGKALVLLALISIAFLLVTALVLRGREYTPARAAGG